VVDQLALDYADQPVVFLEHSVDYPQGDRYSRWWAAYGGGGSVVLPLVMVDSGFRYSNGNEDFYDRYQAMVEDALERPAQAELEVQRERVGNAFRFTVAVTNLSGETLGTANAATVHAIVWEDAHVGDTDRWVRGADFIAISSLEPGATGSFSLEVEPQAVSDWNQVHSVVLVDYRPSGTTGPWDMLNAVVQE
jgi:hypothetical protein